MLHQAICSVSLRCAAIRDRHDAFYQPHVANYSEGINPTPDLSKTH